MEKGFVLFSEKSGIYLGGFLGLGFWTFLDPAGQDCAVTFKTEKEALAHAREAAPEEEVRTVEVDIDKDKHFASIKSCVRADLPMWNPNGVGFAEDLG